MRDERLLYVLIISMAALFLLGAIFSVQAIIYHIIGAVFGVVVIVVAFGMYGMIHELNLVVVGIVMLACTHILEILTKLVALSEYASMILEHMLFFIGMAFVLFGIWSFKKVYKFK